MKILSIRDETDSRFGITLTRATVDLDELGVWYRDFSGHLSAKKAADAIVRAAKKAWKSGGVLGSLEGWRKLRSNSSAMNMDEWAERTADRLAKDIKFWVDAGYSFEDAKKRVFATSTAGPKVREEALRIFNRIRSNPRRIKVHSPNVDFRAETNCRYCQGRGRIEVGDLGHAGETWEIKCKQCKGTGRKLPGKVSYKLAEKGAAAQRRHAALQSLREWEDFYKRRKNPRFTGSGFTAEKAWKTAARSASPIKVSAKRAAEIEKEARSYATYGPWSDQLTKAMEPGEYRYIYDLWNTLPGGYSFAGVLNDIRLGIL